MYFTYLQTSHNIPVCQLFMLLMVLRDIDNHFKILLTFNIGLSSISIMKPCVCQGDFDAGYLYECEFVSDDDKISMQKGKLYEPCQCIPVIESNDVPITTITFR